MITGFVLPEASGLWAAISARPDVDLHVAGMTTAPGGFQHAFFQPAPLSCVDTHTLTPQGWLRRGQLWWFYPRLRDLLRELRPTVLHIATEPWGFLAVQSIASHPAVVIHAAETHYQQGIRIEDAVRTRVARHVLRRAAGFVGWSTLAVRAALANGFPDGRPTAVMPAELPVPQQVSPKRVKESDELRVGFAGRLVHQKGLDLLLDATASLDVGPVGIVVAGTGPDAAALRRLAEHLQVRCHWLGAVPQREMKRFYGEIDVLVLPSRTVQRWEEQFGKVLVEAMMRGIPVIGSDCGAIPEVISGGGQVFPEDDSEALADLLRPFHSLEARYEAATRAVAWVRSRFHPACLAHDMVSLWASAAQTATR